MKPRLIPYGTEIYFDYNDNLKPICKQHMMEVDIQKDWNGSWYQLNYVKCVEGHTIQLDRTPSEIKTLITRRMNSKLYEEAEIFDIDGYLVPASKEVQLKSKTSEYSITSQVKKSDTKGEQIVIYVGKKGVDGKSQIFVDPTYGKITFDQNDISPKDIFVKIEATFRDGSKASLVANDNQGGVK